VRRALCDAAAVVVVLIPPSEKKAAGSSAPFAVDGGAFPELAAARGRLVAALSRAAGGRNRARAFGVEGKALDDAVALAARWPDAGLLAAHDRYQGVLYDHLAFASLPAAARRRAGRDVVVTSALWGLAALDDPVPDYRLALAGKPFGAPRPSIGAAWRATLAASVDALVARSGDLVVDLLPTGYADVVGPARRGAAAVGVTWVRVRFEDAAGRIAPSFNAKARKGAFTRHLVGSARAGDSPAVLARAMAAFDFQGDGLVTPADLHPGINDLVIAPR
jgi:cytoplasmic iron level regulating protein YaaA (DUF328/UPF0246 family)